MLLARALFSVSNSEDSASEMRLSFLPPSHPQWQPGLDGPASSLGDHRGLLLGLGSSEAHHPAV